MRQSPGHSSGGSGLAAWPVPVGVLIPLLVGRDSVLPLIVVAWFGRLGLLEHLVLLRRAVAMPAAVVASFLLDKCAPFTGGLWVTPKAIGLGPLLSGVARLPDAEHPAIPGRLMIPSLPPGSGATPGSCHGRTRNLASRCRRRPRGRRGSRCRGASRADAAAPRSRWRHASP